MIAVRTGKVGTENREDRMDWWHWRKGDSGTMRKNNPSVFDKGTVLLEVLSKAWELRDPRGEAGIGGKAYWVRRQNWVEE